MSLREQETAFQITFLKENQRRKNLLGDHSVVDPPDSMPNSEVKRNSADGSVGSPHVRVGHRQALISFLDRPSRNKMDAYYSKFATAEW